MLRGTLLTASLFAAVVEPSLMPGDDLLTKALTQGGLLAVVLVLLWYIKQKHAQELAEKDSHLADKDERLQVMVSLISDTKVALTETTKAIGALANSQQNMSIVLAKIEERRHPR